MIIGIDISKDTFDVAIPTEKEYRMTKYQNTPSGINQFIKQLSPTDHCVMEATGPYWYRLANTLAAARYSISVVNPLQIKRFAQMKLSRTKTDPADARIICEYGQLMNPKPYTPPPAYLTQLKELRSLREQLVNSRVSFQNQLHALKQMPCVDTVALRACRKIIETLNREIKNVEQRMHKLLQEHCAALAELIMSIPSIGPCTTVELIVATRGFTAFDSPKQFAAYAGICPRVYQSGTSIAGAGHICKTGMSDTRKILYLCAVSAVRFNQACKQFYHRLVKSGKPKRVALIAVANKLIRQVFAVVRNNKPFVNIIEPEICF